MIELAIVFMLMTASVMMSIIALFVIIDSRRESRRETEKRNRNFGFSKKNIDIERKEDRK